MIRGSEAPVIGGAGDQGIGGAGDQGIGGADPDFQQFSKIFRA